MRQSNVEPYKSRLEASVRIWPPSQQVLPSALRDDQLGVSVTCIPVEKAANTRSFCIVFTGSINTKTKALSNF